LTYSPYPPYYFAVERKPTRFELRLPPELSDEIDGWRRTQHDLPPRAEAARRLIELGLKAAATPKRRARPGDHESQ
jgi:hypothetical protein